MRTAPEQRAAHGNKPRKIRVKRYRGMRGRQRKRIALLLAALIPGMGHIYLGMYRRGITFIMLLLLDISALLYFSSIGMQINVPLLVVLGLLIPVGYFYNVYDALQSAEVIISHKRRSEGGGASVIDGKRRGNPFRGERGAAFGITLVGSGALLILFHNKPPWLQAVIRDYGTEATAVVLIAAGVWVAVREATRHRKSNRRFRGRDASSREDKQLKI